MGSESYVYFLLCPKTKRVKIGRTNDLVRRVRSLQTISQSDLILIGAIFERDGQTESELHAAFRKFNVKHEWFTAHPALIAAIETITTVECDCCCDSFLPDYDLVMAFGGFGCDEYLLCDDCRLEFEEDELEEQKECEDADE